MYLCERLPYMSRCPQRPEEGVRVPRVGQVVVSCLMWVLGTDPGSFGRAVVPLATVISAASVKGAFMQIWRTC